MQPELEEPQIPVTFNDKLKKRVELIVYFIKLIFYLIVSAAVVAGTIANLRKDWVTPRNKHYDVEQLE
jgi:hypothetical protein